MKSRFEASCNGYIGMFLDVVSEYPDFKAFTRITTSGVCCTTTYAELLASAERMRHTLIRKGLKAGEVALIVLPSGADMAATIFAVSSLGAIFTTINPDLTDFELNRILENCRPACVISNDRQVDYQTIRFAINPDEDLDSARSPLEAPEGNPIVSCHYTYKGLGIPLGVLHRYEEYSWCLRALSMAYTFEEPGATHLLALPVYQIYGIIGGLFGPLVAGYHTLLIDGIFEQNIPKLLDQHQVSLMCVVPLLLHRTLMSLKRRMKPLPNFNFHPKLMLLSGGSLMTAEVAREMKEYLGIDVYQGYGLTETMPVTGTAPGRDKPGSIGLPFANFLEFAILDPESRPLAPNCAGEIGFRGPTLMTGFLNQPGMMERYFHHGWFHTGDLGYVDADGYLFHIGRSAPFTKVASQLVDLTEVENILTSQPGVTGARVTVDMHPNLGEMLVASVKAEPGFDVTADKLRAACRANLSMHKIPRHYRIHSHNGDTY